MRRNRVIVFLMLCSVSVLYANTIALRMAQGSFSLFRKGLRYHYPEYSKKVLHGKLAAPAFVRISGNRYRFAKGTKVVFYRNGRVARAALESRTAVRAAGTVLQLLPGGGSWQNVCFHKDGSLSRVPLAADVSIGVGGKIFVFRKSRKEREMLYLYPGGGVRFACLKNPLKCRIGKNRVFLAAGRMGFSPDGHIRFAELKGHPVLRIGPNRIKVRGGSLYQTGFYERGGVRETRLFRPQRLKIGSHTGVFQYRIRFDGRGRVSRGNLGASLRFRGEIFRSGWTVVLRYGRSGELKRVSRYRYPRR